MGRKLKPSGRVFLGSMAVGALIGGGAWLLWPGAVWWVYAGGAFILGAVLYPQLIEHFANVVQMDRNSRDS